MADISDIIYIRNTDSAPFEVVYDSVSYGVIEPGQVKLLPRFIADNAVKHLIDQIINRMGDRTDNQVLRDRFIAEIVVKEELITHISERERNKLEVEEINRNSDLAGYLNRAKESAAAAPVKNDGILPELDLTKEEPAPAVLPAAEAQPIPPVAVGESGGVVPTTPVAPPTDDVRAQIYNHAKNVMKMNLDDPKTMAALEAMDIPTLKNTVQYEG
jgi:hypothetical protein